MTKIYHKNIKDKKLEILNSFRIGSWIYVENPIEEELDSLSKEFKLDRSLLKDAIDVYEVPRMETEGKNIYIFSRFPYSEGGQTLTAPILLVMGEDFLMTVSLKKLPFLDRFTEEKIDFYTTQKTKLFLQLFSHINSSYNSFLNEINKKTRGLSIKADNIRNRDIIQFVSFEEIINDFLSSLVPTNNLLQNLLSGRSLKLYEDDKDLIEDLFLHNGQLIELSRSRLKTIVNIRNAYSTILTNNLNRVIRFLTALTIILTVPVIVSGFYGMNVTLPFANSPLAFGGIVIFVTIVVGGLLTLFIRNKWL